MAAYCTQYMESYRSPHESPTGCNGVNTKTAQMKSENKKLRIENETLKKQLQYMKEQMKRIELAVAGKNAYRYKRPEKLNLENI